MSDEDLANAFLWAPPGPVPDGVRLELHRRGLWRLLSPARKVCRLLLAAEPDAAALSAAARALPDATWHYLASHERVVGGAHRAQFLEASGGYRPILGIPVPWRRGP